MAGVVPVVGAGPAPYPSLRNVSLVDIVLAVKDADSAIRWAQLHGLLAGSQVCQNCPNGIAMVMEDCCEGDGKCWHCPTAGCRYTRSLRHGSFYTN